VPDFKSASLRMFARSQQGSSSQPLQSNALRSRTLAASARRSILRQAIIEAVEPRQLLSVSTDAQGWTNVTPDADTRVVYVSSSGGNNANDGLSQGTPVATIAYAKTLLRDGMGDQMLLKKGDVWRESLGYWKISGKSADQPLLIGAYGTGARPELDITGSYGFGAGSPSQTLHDVVIQGIHVYAAGRDPNSALYSPGSLADGFYISGNTTNLLFEDDQVDFFRNNFISTDYYAPSYNFQVRRCIITDAYSTTAVHSQGMYLQGIHGILLDGNTFDHNGWNEGVGPAVPTLWNHNVYVNGTNSDFVARNNIFANASSHGLQARVGGNVENNLFLDNPLGLSYGLVNGSGPLVPGGVTGTVVGNVFLGGRDINGQARGLGIEMANIKPGDGVVVSDNIFANSYNGGLFAAINLSVGNNHYNGDAAVGLNDVTVKDNIVYNWTRGLWINPAMINGGTGKNGVNGINISNNDFQQIQSSNIVYTGIGMNPLYETVSGNRYNSQNLGGAPFYMAGQAYSLPGWSDSVESDAQDVQADYTDPTRNIDTLDAQLGGNGTKADWLQQSRANSRDNWKFSFTGPWATTYMRGGFFDLGDSTPAIPGGWIVPFTPLPTVVSPPPGQLGGGSSGGGSGGTGGTGGTGTGGTGTGGTGTGGTGTGGTDGGTGGTGGTGTGGRPGFDPGGSGTGTGTGTGGTGTGGTGTGGTGTGTGTGGTGTGTGGTGTGTGTGTGGTTGTPPDSDHTGDGTGGTIPPPTIPTTPPPDPGTPVVTGDGDQTVVVWYNPGSTGSSSGNTDADGVGATYVDRKGPGLQFKDGYWYLA
jgi:hypothetical protein